VRGAHKGQTDIEQACFRHNASRFQIDLPLSAICCRRAKTRRPSSSEWIALPLPIGYEDKAEGTRGSSGHLARPAGHNFAASAVVALAALRRVKKRRRSNLQ
jgi:hypothetical protein